MPRVIARLAATPGVAEVYDGPTGCARFELPADRLGDVIVVSERDMVLGKAPEAHDLSLLREPLRSHGGVSEQTVPFVLNRALVSETRAGTDLRNFDIFDYALNRVA